MTEESQEPCRGICTRLAGGVLPEQAEEPVGDDRTMGKMWRRCRPQARTASKRNAIPLLFLLHPQPSNLDRQV